MMKKIFVLALVVGSFFVCGLFVSGCGTGAKEVLGGSPDTASIGLPSLLPPVSTGYTAPWFQAITPIVKDINSKYPTITYSPVTTFPKSQILPAYIKYADSFAKIFVDPNANNLTFKPEINNTNLKSFFPLDTKIDLLMILLKWVTTRDLNSMRSLDFASIIAVSKTKLIMDRVQTELMSNPAAFPSDMTDGLITVLTTLQTAVNDTNLYVSATNGISSTARMAALNTLCSKCDQVSSYLTSAKLPAGWVIYNWTYNPYVPGYPVKTELDKVNNLYAKLAPKLQDSMDTNGLFRTDKINKINSFCNAWFGRTRGPKDLPGVMYNALYNIDCELSKMQSQPSPPPFPTPWPASLLSAYSAMDASIKNFNDVMISTFNYKIW